MNCQGGPYQPQRRAYSHLGKRSYLEVLTQVVSGDTGQAFGLEAELETEVEPVRTIIGVHASQSVDANSEIGRDDNL